VRGAERSTGCPKREGRRARAGETAWPLFAAGDELDARPGPTCRCVSFWWTAKKQSRVRDRGRPVGDGREEARDEARRLQRARQGPRALRVFSHVGA